ncbi:MAG: endonuclease, partial [Amycolatopsis sp.]|uniref:HNH endonuclease signature motif containing protein n=1 Tax=Amycolatopsis sp. TaxID=37632 RepID=UPI00261FA8D0
MTSTDASATPTEWWRVDGPVLVTEYINLEENRRRTEAEQGRILAEIKRRGVRDTTGYGTLPALIRETVHASTTDALARVKRSDALHPGCDLTGTPTPPLAPATADAAREGVIGNAQIDAITSILGKIPATVSDHDREQAEKILVGLARSAGVREILKAGRQLLDRLDPDGPEPKPKDPKPVRRELAFVNHRDGSLGITGTLDDETFARLKAALEPMAKPKPANEEGRDQRSQWERYGDAFSEFVRIGMGNPDLPNQAGDTTHIVVTLSYDQLLTGLGRACLDLVGDITATQARMLACEAKIIPVVLGGHGEPLDVGRSRRSATPAQRCALAIRDGGCAFPGCDAPPQRCIGHHIVLWAHHGETRISNLVFLCAAHHNLMHYSE